MKKTFVIFMTMLLVFSGAVSAGIFNGYLVDLKDEPVDAHMKAAISKLNGLIKSNGHGNGVGRTLIRFTNNLNDALDELNAAVEESLPGMTEEQQEMIDAGYVLLGEELSNLHVMAEERSLDIASDLEQTQTRFHQFVDDVVRPVN